MAVEYTELSNYIKGLFDEFKNGRKPFELIWEECWYNYIGLYQPNLNWKPKTEGAKNRSRVFIKLTTLKCNTAHSKIMDVIFGKSTCIPFELEGLVDGGQMADYINAMEDVLRNHFKSVNILDVFDTAILDMIIFGTAVLKGPIIERRIKHVVVPRTIGGMPVSEIASDVAPYSHDIQDELIPVVDVIPIWDYYTDVNANSPADAIGEIHFQRLLPAMFKQKFRSDGFIIENVDEAYQRATTDPEDAEDSKRIQLGDNYSGSYGKKDKRVSVLEYWGLVPVKMLRDAGVQVSDKFADDDSVESFVVLAADGLVIKACVNPLNRRPFYVCPYKKKPHVIYGQGVAEAMRDSQKMINSSARMIIDNKALSGNGMVGLNLSRLDTRRMNNDFSIYGRKVWFVKGNFSPRDAVDSISFPDVTGGLRELMEMFERFADEETGIPKYTHGEQSTFLNKTASGMSMLMTQANINLKTVIKNIDSCWIEPIVEAFYDWFATFGDVSEMAGMPAKVVATGTDSLIAKELRMENLMKFMQVTSNREDAIFMDRVKLIKEIADILETRNILRSDEEIKQIMQQMSQMAKPNDMREFVDIDKLYPYLTREEQVQVLQLIGIQPSQIATAQNTEAMQNAGVIQNG